MWTLKCNGRAMADLTGSISRTIKISDGNKNTPIVLPCPYPHSPFSSELQRTVTYKSENNSLRVENQEQSESTAHQGPL